MDQFDEETVATFDPVCAAVDALRLPLLLQRRYTCIANAIKVQLECGSPSRLVIGHLTAALLALMHHDGLSRKAKPIESALAAFERSMESKLK
jgi:hypothetical protein